ncbi:MAG: ribonuclease Z [Candidatus Woesearchaeota archaeon]
MEIIFLGTSCSMPTKERNHPAIFVSHQTEGILLDCGENTQRQLRIAGIRPTRINKILISHWHGDHVLGLGGLLQTFAGSDYTTTLKIYGPKGTKQYFENLRKSFAFDAMPELELHEVNKGIIYQNNEIIIEAALLKHRIPCVGYSIKEKDKRKIDMKKTKKLGLKEGPLLGKIVEGKTIEVNDKKIHPDDVSYIKKGRKIAYVADTLPCDGAINIAKDADILIAEATYKSDLQEKAHDNYHMTAKEAALIANKANVKKLYLFHYSTRYKKTLELIEDARKYFDNVFGAEDFLEVKL